MSYVTDTLKQCDIVPVVRNVSLPWNPDSENITISTNSVAGSKEGVYVSFEDKDGDFAGGVVIAFDKPIKYWLGYCTEAHIPFPETVLPTDTNKIWTITYNYTDKRVVYYCNGVQVVNVVLSASACTEWNVWSKKWDSKPTQIKFDSDDIASDSYCISSNPGKYNGCY